MPNELQIALTGFCQPSPGEHQFLLPAGVADPGKPHVLVWDANTKLILAAGRRAEAGGNAACVPGGVLQALGGEGGVVSYRAIGTPERVWRDRRLLVQCLIALLTFAGACLTAYTAWIKTNASTTATGWEQDTAAVALIIAALLAIFKFYKELSDL